MKVDFPAILVPDGNEVHFINHSIAGCQKFIRRLSITSVRCVCSRGFLHTLKTHKLFPVDATDYVAAQALVHLEREQIPGLCLFEQIAE